MARIEDVIKNKYKIITELGRGGMSVVYLAMDSNLDKQWAIKEIRKNGSRNHDEMVADRLIEEAHLMKNFDHPAIPRIVDILYEGDTIYEANTIFVIMDYIKGKSLDKVLKESGIQSETDVVEWAKQICDVLSYLHSQNPPIIYRDMKPANVMLKDGNIKIIDFGIARKYTKEKLKSGEKFGTKGYAAPEMEKGYADQRSDIYALGMTMHTLLTGIDPRTEGYEYVPVRQWIPELSEGIEIIIDKCVQPEAENRYQTCAELLYDLQNPEMLTAEYRKKQKRHLTSFIVAAACSVLLLISGIACNLIAGNINANNYEELISVVEATSLEEKINSYKQAIEIYPEDARAYLKILEAYEDENRFGKDENDEFLAIYNAKKELFDDTSVDVAELNYNIGKMYFNYYKEQDGSYSFSNRVQKAYPFFAANYENEELVGDFEHESLSNCYYQICAFYKQYVLSSATVEEASQQDYETLFESIRENIEEVKTASAYDQLILYNGAFMFLYDQRASMVSVSVEKENIMELLDMVYQNAKGLSVQKEQSQKLQQEILDNYDNYKEAIERVYTNAEERS